MNKFNAIPILADILSDSVKEKVTRIVLAVFRNLIEKPEDQQVIYFYTLLYITIKSINMNVFTKNICIVLPVIQTFIAKTLFVWNKMALSVRCLKIYWLFFFDFLYQ